MLSPFDCRHGPQSPTPHTHSAPREGKNTRPRNFLSSLPPRGAFLDIARARALS